MCLDLVSLGVSLRPTFLAPPFGRSTRGSVQLDRARVGNLPSSVFHSASPGEMLPAVSGIGKRFADSFGAFASIWRNAEPPVARARVDGFDRRPLRLSHRGVGLRLRCGRREGRRARLPGATHPGRARRPVRRHARRPLPHASASCSSRTSPASCSSVRRPSASSSTPTHGSSTASRSRRRSRRRRSAPRRPRSRLRSPERPEELTAANAVASGVESIAVFVGPGPRRRAPRRREHRRRLPRDRRSSSSSRRSSSLLIHVDHADQPRRELEASTIAAERLAGSRRSGRTRHCA